MNGLPEQYQTPEGLRTLANYLRSQNGVKVRSGIEHEKRVDYFKGINSKNVFINIITHSTNGFLGKRLIECLLEAKKWPKSIPQITDKAVARLVAQELIQASFFHRSDKVEDKKGHLQVWQIYLHQCLCKIFYIYRYQKEMYSKNLVITLGCTVVIWFGLT